MKLEELEAAALKLDAKARARLAERLLSSLETLSDAENAQLWAEEAQRRDAELDKAHLPISVALRRYAATRNKPAWRWILNGGEDYELPCTAPERQAPKLQTKLQTDLGLSLTDIGQVLEPGQGRWLQDGSERQPLSSRGHRHFGHSL